MQLVDCKSIHYKDQHHHVQLLTVLYCLGLDDLCVRFIVNLPKEELESVERICFQVEEAQWFYEDFVRPLDPQLPSLNLRQFCLLIFQHCPLLSGFSPYHHSAAFSEFLAYKTRVPVRGAIMLNEAMDQVVLVKGWKKGANWSFPRGKINKDEKDLDCAVREVYEETGFDIRDAGLVAAEETAKYIEVTMREQHMRLYVFRDVPMDTAFEPRTRKEISKIQWYKLSELPTIKKKQQHQEGRGEDLAKNANKFYMVAPFLVPLKKWIAQQKKQDTMKSVSANSKVAPAVPQTITTAQAVQETDRITEAPPSDNISRLLATLRNSSRKSTISDLTELSDPAQTVKDASIQLKTLLQVPIKSSGNSNGISNYQSLADRRLDDQAQKHLLDRKNESAKANAMSSSLRAAGTISENRPLYSNLPQTPFEQMLGTPPIPSSPRHRAPRAGHGRMPSPPPQFPYSPDQVGLKNEEQAAVVGKGQSTTLASGRYPLSPSVQRFSAPLLPRTSLQNSTKAHHLPLAPYQRTGDPHFAQVSKQSADITSSIPPASNLPLPKLTSHSSLLLDIFKSGDFGRASLDPSTTKVNSAAVENNSKLEPQKSNLYAENLEDTSTKARSPQKEVLLNLFRASSSSAPGLAQTTPTTLEPPSAPIELSAYPSPSHSRATSQIDQKSFMPLSNATISGDMSMRKKQERTVGRKPSTKAPVSATVTGPLNVPQFDRIVKKPGSPRSANIPPRRHEEVKEQQATPMTILTRPGSKPQSSLSKAVKPIKENIKSRAHSHTPTSQSKVDKQVVEPSKPFAPQILRRPPQEQHPKHETLPPVSPLHIITKDHVIPDGPSTSGSPAPDHRHSLLSLFNKPSPGPSPLTPTYKPFVNSLSEKPVRSESTVPFRLDSPRSRMGSLDDGSVAVKDGRDSERQTPRTKPADKMVLLNFLDDIIKKG